jgi:sigma-E factor negative regulatory protein RseC
MAKSDNFESIEHDGIVQKADEKSLTVRISSASACSGCHAEGSCTLAGKEDKIIDISGYYNVMAGDIVTVVMKKSMGYTAVALGYILPFLGVITILIILASLSVPELIAGLASLAILIPYYIILYFFRNRINNKFTFTLKA